MPRTASLTKPQRTRRLPQQGRAVHTQKLMFEAALRLLEAEGLAAFSTNRLAQVSGFSVGAIYQYFGNKHELLAALARHEIGAAIEGARRRAKLPGGDPVTRARAAARNLLGMFGGRAQAHRELLVAALSSGKSDVIKRLVLELAALLEERRYISAARGVHRLDGDEAFVLANAVMGPIHAALLTDPRRLRSAAFENALVRLIVGFFVASSALQELRAD